MATEQLTAYLTDHLAGSRSALDLLEHLEFVHNDMLLARFFADLRDHDSRPPGARSTYGAAANRSEPYPAGDGG